VEAVAVVLGEKEPQQLLEEVLEVLAGVQLIM
jgi:hypothetical protein